ncbi:transporter [Nesterenkonia sp.]|uniref:transporter n=1 Tax=Nesterenkonia sp. TaxID=704201 RepID=UPI00262B8ABC|nr:transporter [Nesterenkonia sp.]
MAATLIRLKLTLLGATYRRSGWALAGTIIAGLYGLGILAMAVAFQASEGGSASAPQELLVPSAMLSAGITIAWLAVPLLMTGGDSLMDPRQLVTYGLPRRDLVIGLSASRMISVGAVLTLIWLLGQTLLWRSYPGAAALALVTAPLLLLAVTVASQAVTTAASAWLSGRRWRDLLAVIGLGLAMLAYPIITSVTEAFESLGDALPELAQVLALTPLAAGIALPYDAATGQWGMLVVRLLIVAATLAAALLLMRAALISLTERPRAQSGGSSRRKGVGLFALFPARPWAAVAARCLTYWMRDPRYGGSLVVLPALTVLALFLWWQSELTWPLYALGPFIAWVLGYSISADVSYDHTAFALHVTTGVTGIADRAGRTAALLSFAVPLTLLASAVPMLILGRADHLLVVTSLSLGMLLSSCGLSAVISAKLIYPTPRPGDSPFKQPEGVGGRMMIIQLGAMLATALLMLPDLVLLILWAVAGTGWSLVLLVSATLLKGAALVAAGILIGGTLYERTAPELFQRVAAH